MWAIALLSGCVGGPGATGPTAGQDAVEPMRPTTQVSLTLPSLNDGVRWESETIARVIRTIEANLHAAPGVVVEVAGTKPAPSVRNAPRSPQGSWGVSISVTATRDTVQLKALTCAPQGSCSDAKVFTDLETPEPAAAELARSIMTAAGIQVSDAVLPCMSTAPSADAYHSLIAGRGAAVLYGLVQPTVEGDRSGDPLERAVYLGPKMGVAQWVAGRGRLDRGDIDGAASAFELAHELCPDHQGFAADLAHVQLERGKRRAAVSIVDGLGVPDDPRLVPLRLDAWIAAGRIADAGQLAVRADTTFPDDARVARVMAELAEAENDLATYERWLREWARRAPEASEPITRLVGILAEAQRWNDVWESLPDLEARGMGDVAKQWRVTAGLALGRFDAAAEAASADVADRIRARATLQGAAAHQLSLQSDPSPEAALARGREQYRRGNSKEALSAADAALRMRPWWPEALALRADALDGIGDRRGAAKARAEWRAAEPPEFE